MARRRPDGWWYPWTFVAGMLVVVAVNGVLVAYAIGTFPGLETEDAYRKGLAYNSTMAAAREQEARGWQADVRFQAAAQPGTQPDQGRGGELTVSLTDRDGTPLPGLTVSAILLRPTHRADDVHVTLDARGAGRYAGAVAVPLAGQWDAWVHASGPGGEFQTTQRIFIP